MYRVTTYPKELSSYRVYLLVACILFAIWAGIIWTNRQSENQGLGEIKKETAALALLFSTHVDTTFRTVDLALLEFRREPHSPPEVLSKVIGPHLQLLSSAVVQTAILNEKGLVTYSTPISVSTPTYADDREFFKAHQSSSKDELIVGRPIKGKVTGKWSIPLSRPIFEDGRFAGVVVIAVDPDYFVNFYQSAGLGHDGAARMIRDTGEIMARSSEQWKYVGTLVKPSPYADPGAPVRGSFRRLAQTDGVDRLSSYHRLPQYGLTVVIGPSVDERLAAIHSYQQQLIGAAIVLSSLIIAIAWQLLRNINKNSAFQIAISENEAKFRSLFESMSEGVVLHRVVEDKMGNIVNYQILDANQAFETHTGIARDTIIGKLSTDAYQVSEPPFLDLFAQVARSGIPTKIEQHFEKIKKDLVIHVFSPRTGQFATVLEDVTEKNLLQSRREEDHRQLEKQYLEILQLQKELQYQVLHDPLTKLNNRRYLEEALPREFARAKREGYPVSFIMVDLDRFKRVNDTYGHSFGDSVLAKISELLKANSRESDIVCRFGGEEFLMVMPHLPLEQAYQKMDAIRQEIAVTGIAHAGLEINVTVSAGIASYPAHGYEIDTLIKRADEALYQAKSDGRNRVNAAPVETSDGLHTGSV